MLVAKTHQAKAKDRANALWHHYDIHGRLLISDVIRLTGATVDQLLKSFAFHGLTAPPIWDSQAEKVKRKAQALWSEAYRQGGSSLTGAEAAAILGCKPNRVPGVLTQLQKHNFVFPEIIMADRPPVANEINEIAPRLCGIINPYSYPAGLQYWKRDIGPSEITYYLR